MELTNKQRTELRVCMLATFDSDSLSLFAEDNLDLQLDHHIGPGQTLTMLCQKFIRLAEQMGKLRAFLEAVQADTANTMNQPIKALAGLLLATSSQAAQAAGSGRSHVINNRPVLNRTNFWRSLHSLAAGGHSRVMTVAGGVGTSYSRWPISHVCASSSNGARLACVDVNAGHALSVDAASLAALISTRLWGSAGGFDVDELPQAARQAKDFTPVLLQRLSTLTAPTWLVIDQLNKVSLDQSATELLSRLCEAVDANECPNLSLFFFGLEPSKLPSRVGPYLAIDLVQRPTRQDIEDYVLWFAQTIGRPGDPVSCKTTVDELDGLLPHQPDHATWELFHSQLLDRCKKIKEGVLP